jgi:hypothetical protein
MQYSESLQVGFEPKKAAIRGLDTSTTAQINGSGHWADGTRYLRIR